MTTAISKKIKKQILEEASNPNNIKFTKAKAIKHKNETLIMNEGKGGQNQRAYNNQKRERENTVGETICEYPTLEEAFKGCVDQVKPVEGRVKVASGTGISSIKP